MEKVRVTCDCGHTVECLAYGTGVDIEEYKAYLVIYGCPRCVFGDISLPALTGPEHMIDRARGIRRQRVEHMLYALKELEQSRGIARVDKEQYRRAVGYMMEITRAGFWIDHQSYPIDDMFFMAAQAIEHSAGAMMEIGA